MYRVNFEHKISNEINFCDVIEADYKIYCYFDNSEIFILSEKCNRYFWSNFSLSECTGVGVSGGFRSFSEAMSKAGESKDIMIFESVLEVINYFEDR